jgi:hypothetical protein
VEIPHEKWQSLSVAEVVELFRDAPFAWCLAGGYAIEKFLSYKIRAHGDIDITVFRDEQLHVQNWLTGWQLYAADPPGTLRPWRKDEYLSVGIHDIWGHQIGVDAWQMQIMITEVDGTEWVSRRDDRIRGQRADLITIYDGVPCLRPEIQLLYKVRNPRLKDEQDFHACLPVLSAAAKNWLKQHLTRIYPDGHRWLTDLS